MKFNWGHGLALAMALFVAYIGFLVVGAMSTDHDLVTENYYAKELLFDDVIGKSKNYEALDKEFEMKVSGGQMLITFPHSEIDSGLVTLYRPSDKKLDSKYSINLSEPSKQFIDVSKKAGGRYILELEWYVKGVGFYAKKNINL